MHEEGGAASDVGLKEVHSGVSGVPGFDDDVVEFIAEEFVHDVFVLAVHFEEVREGAYRRHAIGIFLVGVCLEEIADGVGGVAVLADEGFERAAPTGEGCDLAT